MTGRLIQRGRPQPFQVWLTLSTVDLGKVEHRAVCDHLRSLPGWDAGLFGSEHLSVTYDANLMNCEVAAYEAHKAMSEAGVELPNIWAYKVWRVTWGLTWPMLDNSDPGFPHVTASGAQLGRELRSIRGVHQTSFSQPGFDTLTVDIQSDFEPDVRLLGYIHKLIHEAEMCT